MRGFKKFLRTVLLLAVLALIGVFFVWPKLILPRLNEENLYTPELVNTYYATERVDGDKCFLTLTITDCTRDGRIVGFMEFLIEQGYDQDIYGKYTVQGTILDKKKNMDLTLQLDFVKWTVEPPESTPAESVVLLVTEGCTVMTEREEGSVEFTTGYDSFTAISTVADLKRMTGSDGVFVLQNDIDLSGMTWAPIRDFSGTLIGNGYKISNMTVDTNTSDVGFFSNLEGRVTNLTLENASVRVEGERENVGILCGSLQNGSLNQIVVSGSVDALQSKNVGGMVGYAEIERTQSMTYLESRTAVKGLSHTGGLFGYVRNGVEHGNNTYFLLLEYIGNYGAVTAAQDYCGGIVGYLTTEDRGTAGEAYVRMNDCHNQGDLDGRYYVGGIVGHASGERFSQYSTLNNCTNRSKIRGDAYVGCIAGYAYRTSVRNASNEGSSLDVRGFIPVEGNQRAYVGGLVGCGLCLENCTNYIDIVYTGGGSYVGGLMGYCNDKGSYHMRDLRNLGQISGADYVGGIMGMQDNRMTNDIKENTVTMERLVNEGDVIGSGSYVGGHVGFCTGDDGSAFGSVTFSIFDSDSYGNIQGAECVGGSIGCFDYASNATTDISFRNCYARGTINLISNGELVGEYRNQR